MTIATTGVRKHLTDIHEWRKLGEANIFPPESHLELIEGEILEMAPIGFNHAGHVIRLNKLFNKVVGEHAIISIQNPLQLSNLSEPEPDFALLRPDADDYTTRHPNAEDVLLLIEVADSSFHYDQNEKQRLYARYQIPEYWLINLNNSTIEIYRQPCESIYQQKTTLKVGDSITLSQLDIMINVNDIL